MTEIGSPLTKSLINQNSNRINTESFSDKFNDISLIEKKSEDRQIFKEGLIKLTKVESEYSLI